MSFTVTLSGKCGDIIYELAGIRALAASRNEPALVSLWQDEGMSLTAGEIDSLIPLIRSQSNVASAMRWGGQRPDVAVHGLQPQAERRQRPPTDTRSKPQRRKATVADHRGGAGWPDAREQNISLCEPSRRLAGRS
jgi:hypothetical protein